MIFRWRRSLASCGLVDLISKELSYSKAVATDLENTTGVKPEVGFNRQNGSLQWVTVTFPNLHVGKPVDEPAGTVREVVIKVFKQTPRAGVLNGQATTASN